MWRPDLSPSVELPSSPPSAASLVSARERPSARLAPVAVPRSHATGSWWPSGGCCGLRGRAVINNGNAFDTTIVAGLLRHYRTLMAQTPPASPAKPMPHEVIVSTRRSPAAVD